MSSSIWTTLEMHCISCGFLYPQYWLTHKDSGTRAAPLSEKGYNALDYVFYVEVEQANLHAPKDIEVTTIPLDEYFNG